MVKLASMNTGEDVQGLRKIVDFTRLLSIFILVIHFYMACYQAFAVWEWTAGITDRIIGDISRTVLFEGLFRAKLAALLLLVVSLIGVKGRKEEKIEVKPILLYLIVGVGLYFASALCFFLPNISPGSKTSFAVCYIGYVLLILVGGVVFAYAALKCYDEPVCKWLRKIFGNW